MKELNIPCREIIPPAITETLGWLLNIEDFESARGLARSVYRFLPRDRPESNDFLAYVLHRAKFHKEAAEVALKTLAMIPESSDAKFNAAKCLNLAARPNEAESLIREVIADRPDWISPELDLAVYVGIQGRNDEAFRILRSLPPRMRPDDKDLEIVKFNLGWHYVRLGRFKEGMTHLIGGRKIGVWGTVRDGATRFRKPMLVPGSDLRGKTVLLLGEGGAGDEMINARFGQTIQERGGKAIWCPQKPLSSILSRVPGIDRIVDAQSIGSIEYDFWAPAMDLPALLDLDLIEIPNRPYLSPDPAFVKKWADRIPRSGNLKVGLRWQGNGLYEHDLMRSVPFSILEGLTDISGVDFYSLQKDNGREEIGKDSPVHDLADGLETWEDTAGAIANLDLVISSCTSVAHLAAAMGKRTWLLCPLNCYYIWATPGNVSHWYPSLRLFRQQELNSWGLPLLEVRDQLSEPAFQ